MEQEQPSKFIQPMFLKFDMGQIPTFKEVKSKDWIYYGDNNLWPDYVIELYQRSAKHNAITNGKVNYIIGGGFRNTTNKWIEKVNPYQTLQELATSLTYDLELFNGFAIEIIYNMKGSIGEMYHVDFSKVRTNKDESTYYYCNNWKVTNPQLRKEETEYKEYTPFDFNAKKKSKGSQLYVFTIKTPRQSGEHNVYPVPEYMGALSAIETDVEINNFHLTNIKTGFSAGTMINLLNGQPTPEEAKQLEKRFIQKFTGTDRAGSLILNFAVDKEHAAEVVHMQPSDMDKQYIQLSERVQQEIFTGHKITSPILFGVMTPGSLGQRNEMLDAYELFQATYINYRQSILEDTFNKLAQLSGLPTDLQIVKSKPLTISISEQGVFNALSADEQRKLIGEYLGTELKSAVTPSEKLVALINNINPRVAEKVLTSMTTNEVRQLVGLGATNELPQNQTGIQADAPPPPPQPNAMAAQKQDEIFKFLSEAGEPRANYSIVKKKKTKFSYETFRELTVTERSIIDLLKKDHLMPAEEIAKTLNIEPVKVQNIIERLITRGDLTVNESGDTKEYVPTETGESTIKDNPPPTVSLKVMYSYDWRDEVPEGERDTAEHPSRAFCKKIMALDKYYKRSEIETLSDRVGYDVWAHTGGFWNDNGDIQDHCRHEWQQVIVTKKG